jgi:PD-(D/E)XK nuclease superfamily
MTARFPCPDLGGGDERGGLPSASIYDRIWVCPPSFSHSLLVEVTFAEKLKSGAVQGTTNHEFIAALDAAGRVPQRETESAVRSGDIEALKSLKQRAQNFSESIFAAEGAKLGEKLIEERLWIWRDPLARRNGAGFEFVGSGKADLIWLSDDFRLAVVNDYKTLFGKQKQAPESGQIYALAGILKANIPELETVYGGVHSRENWRSIPARFRSDVLEEVAEQVADTFKRAIGANHENEDSKRTSGECGLCPAASICEKFINRFERSLTEVNKLTQEKDITAMDLRDLEKILRHKGDLEIANKVMDQAEQRALHLIEVERQRSDSLELVPGKKFTRLDQGLLYKTLVQKYPDKQDEIDKFWREHGSLSVEDARRLTGKLLKSDLKNFKGQGMEETRRKPSIRFKM